MRENETSRPPDRPWYEVRACREADVGAHNRDRHGGDIYDLGLSGHPDEVVVESNVPDEEAEFFTVYEVGVDGLSQAVADYPTREAAEGVRDLAETLWTTAHVPAEVDDKAEHLGVSMIEWHFAGAYFDQADFHVGLGHHGPEVVVTETYEAFTAQRDPFVQREAGNILTTYLPTHTLIAMQRGELAGLGEGIERVAVGQYRWVREVDMGGPDWRDVAEVHELITPMRDHHEDLAVEAAGEHPVEVYEDLSDGLDETSTGPEVEGDELLASDVTPVRSPRTYIPRQGQVIGSEDHQNVVEFRPSPGAQHERRQPPEPYDAPDRGIDR